MASPTSPAPAMLPPPSAASLGCLPDDLLLHVLSRLEPDPRDWARVACVAPRMAALVGAARLRSRILTLLPADLLSPATATALYKMAVCCPGLLRAGALLESSDFGLERDIGPDCSPEPSKIPPLAAAPASPAAPPEEEISSDPMILSPAAAAAEWSLLDDLFLDTVYDIDLSDAVAAAADPAIDAAERYKKRKRRCSGPAGAHLASGPWTLSREQGNKLLANRFRGDILYISDWPGCVHAEARRKYMLFRGMFKNFRCSRVWRTIADSRRGKVGLECAFCTCKETWDLHAAFCLRSSFSFHDDGEPVVRAYVCENGHVAGAWTERPMYS